MNILAWVTKNKYLTIGIVIVLIITAIYLAGRKSGKNSKPKALKFDRDEALPAGYSPMADATTLENALLKSPIAINSAVFSVLRNKSNAQLKAIYNQFAQNTSKDLIQVFRDNMGGDATRAIEYFKNVI